MKWTAFRIPAGSVPRGVKKLWTRGLHWVDTTDIHAPHVVRDFHKVPGCMVPGKEALWVDSVMALSEPDSAEDELELEPTEIEREALLASEVYGEEQAKAFQDWDGLQARTGAR